MTQPPAGNGKSDLSGTEELAKLLQQIGHYRVERLPGQGEFRCVYLAAYNCHVPPHPAGRSP